MSTTRKRKALSLEQKLEVYRLMDSGELFRKIAETTDVDLRSVVPSLKLRMTAINASITYIHFEKLKTFDYPKIRYLKDPQKF
ncbi:hypothetical protein T4A_13088, partial [Trichinella pseudospiralis]